MATSGTKSITVTDYDTLKFNWSRTSYSIANNTSTISWNLQLVSTTYGAISSGTSKDWSVTVNGTSYSGTNTIEIANNTTKTLASGTTTITHNTDGTKTFSYSFSQEFKITFSGTYIDTKSGSGSGVLDTIPRTATVLTAPNFTQNDNPTITYSNPAGNSVTTLQACISLTGANADIAYRDIPKTGINYTFNLTTAERNILLNATTGSNSRTVRFYIQTIINGTTTKHYLTTSFTITNGAPTLSPTAVDNNSTTIALTGNSNTFVKYFSNAAVVVNAQAATGASIVSQSVVCGNKSIAAASGTINAVESGTFRFSATDSRGNTTTQDLNKTLINYTKLTCKATIQVASTNSVNITLSGSYFNGSFGAQNNTLTLKYRWKTESGSYGFWNTTSTPTLSDGTFTVSNFAYNLDYTQPYIFEIYAQDKLITVDFTQNINFNPIFDWGKDDFNFNCDVTINGKLFKANQVLWSGAYQMTASQTATLSQNISAQTNGIVLVFCTYNGTSETNNDWVCHFIPKYIAALGTGLGHSFTLTNSVFDYCGGKYIKIYDDELVGSSNNTASGTSSYSNIKYNNSEWVLRFVIGV